MTPSRIGRILESSFNEIYLFDAATLCFVEASRGALENLGYSIEELRHLTPVDLKPMNRAEFEALIEPLRHDESDRIVFETTHRRKDGSLYPVEVRLQLSAEESPPVFLAIIQDISERKAAEQLLQQQTDILRRQAELLDLAQALIRNLDSEIIFWNRGAERLYGWSQQEALGRYSHDLLRTEFPQPLADIEHHFLRTGHWEGELVHTRRDGTRLTVASYWALYRDQHGKPQAVLEVNNDVTRLKHAEQTIRDLNTSLESRVRARTAQLEQANQELEAFSYSVSHDLRGPLRGIDGFSQALLEDYNKVLDDQGKHYLHRIREGSQRMAQLIDDLLNLSRITRSEMHTAWVDLGALAHSVADALRASEPDRPVEIVIAPGMRVQGDAPLLRIALENLLSNAWKFTGRQRHARIEFGVKDQTGERVYFLRDNGVGFDMTYADKLFMAFQRLHRADDFEGTGVGLVTVARIIQRHGGRAWAEASVGHGATFYFTLGDGGEEHVAAVSAHTWHG